MNHPARPVEDELRAIADQGYDFVDLTFEPPRAWPADGDRIGRLLTELGLGAVGHTAYYLPIASPFEGLREQAHQDLLAACREFAAAGINLVNVHPDPLNRLFAVDEIRSRNAEALAGLVDEAGGLGVTLMVENLGRSFGRPEDLAPIFDASAALRFHLDVGHANLGRGADEPNRADVLFRAFGDRLAHVHLNDNLGGDDLHLPLGAGNVDWAHTARLLRRGGYDATFTLEVFSPHAIHVDASRGLWQSWWEAAA
jgi:sugar phosphate isomerase/epimerase